PVATYWLRFPRRGPYVKGRRARRPALGSPHRRPDSRAATVGTDEETCDGVDVAVRDERARADGHLDRGRADVSRAGRGGVLARRGVAGSRRGRRGAGDAVRE